MYVGSELSEEDINKLEQIKDHLSGGGKLKISNSAAIRYLIREYELAQSKTIITPTGSILMSEYFDPKKHLTNDGVFIFRNPGDEPLTIDESNISSFTDGINSAD